MSVIQQCADIPADVENFDRSQSSARPSASLVSTRGAFAEVLSLLSSASNAARGTCSVEGCISAIAKVSNQSTQHAAATLPAVLQYLHDTIGAECSAYAQREVDAQTAQRRVVLAAVLTVLQDELQCIMHPEPPRLGTSTEASAPDAASAPSVPDAAPATASPDRASGSDADTEDDLDGVPDNNVTRCTFAGSGTAFVEQHWYLCYTCGLTGNTGACSSCAQVCHIGHDVVYGTRSRFFCDCGAGEGREPCKALETVRVPSTQLGDGGPPSPCASLCGSASAAPGCWALVPNWIASRQGPLAAELHDKPGSEAFGSRTTPDWSLVGGAGGAARMLSATSHALAQLGELLWQDAKSAAASQWQQLVQRYGSMTMAVNSIQWQQLPEKHGLRIGRQLRLTQSRKSRSVRPAATTDPDRAPDVFGRMQRQLGCTVTSCPSAGILFVAQDEHVTAVDPMLLLAELSVSREPESSSGIGSLCRHSAGFEVQHLAAVEADDVIRLIVADKCNMQVWSLDSTGGVKDRLTVQLPSGAVVRKVGWLPNTDTHVWLLCQTAVYIYNLSDNTGKPVCILTVVERAEDLYNAGSTHHTSCPTPTPTPNTALPIADVLLLAIKETDQDMQQRSNEDGPGGAQGTCTASSAGTLPNVTRTAPSSQCISRGSQVAAVALGSNGVLYGAVVGPSDTWGLYQGPASGTDEAHKPSTIPLHSLAAEHVGSGVYGRRLSQMTGDGGHGFDRGWLCASLGQEPGGKTQTAQQGPMLLKGQATLSAGGQLRLEHVNVAGIMPGVHSQSEELVDVVATSCLQLPPTARLALGSSIAMLGVGKFKTSPATFHKPCAAVDSGTGHGTLDQSDAVRQVAEATDAAAAAAGTDEVAVQALTASTGSSEVAPGGPMGIEHSVRLAANVQVSDATNAAAGASSCSKAEQGAREDVLRPVLLTFVQTPCHGAEPNKKLQWQGAEADKKLQEAVDNRPDGISSAGTSAGGACDDDAGDGTGRHGGPVAGPRRQHGPGAGFVQVQQLSGTVEGATACNWAPLHFAAAPEGSSPTPPGGLPCGIMVQGPDLLHMVQLWTGGHLTVSAAPPGHRNDVPLQSPGPLQGVQRSDSELARLLQAEEEGLRGQQHSMEGAEGDTDEDDSSTLEGSQSDGGDAPAPPVHSRMPVTFFEECDDVSRDIELEGDFSAAGGLARALSLLVDEEGFVEAPTPSGMTMTVRCSTSTAKVICGVKVHVGQSGSGHVPRIITVGTQHVRLPRNCPGRWYSVPFTSAEALMYHPELTIKLHPAWHSSYCPQLDGLRVYARPLDHVTQEHPARQSRGSALGQGQDSLSSAVPTLLPQPRQLLLHAAQPQEVQKHVSEVDAVQGTLVASGDGAPGPQGPVEGPQLVTDASVGGDSHGSCGPNADSGTPGPQGSVEGPQLATDAIMSGHLHGSYEGYAGSSAVADVPAVRAGAACSDPQLATPSAVTDDCDQAAKEPHKSGAPASVPSTDADAVSVQQLLAHVLQSCALLHVAAQSCRVVDDGAVLREPLAQAPKDATAAAKEGAAGGSGTPTAGQAGEGRNAALEACAHVAGVEGVASHTTAARPTDAGDGSAEGASTGTGNRQAHSSTSSAAQVHSLATWWAVCQDRKQNASQGQHQAGPGPPVEEVFSQVDGVVQLHPAGALVISILACAEPWTLIQMPSAPLWQCLELLCRCSVQRRNGESTAGWCLSLRSSSGDVTHLIFKSSLAACVSQLPTAAQALEVHSDPWLWLHLHAACQVHYCLVQQPGIAQQTLQGSPAMQLGLTYLLQQLPECITLARRQQHVPASLISSLFESIARAALWSTAMAAAADEGGVDGVLSSCVQAVVAALTTDQGAARLGLQKALYDLLVVSPASPTAASAHNDVPDKPSGSRHQAAQAATQAAAAALDGCAEGDTSGGGMQLPKQLRIRVGQQIIDQMLQSAACAAGHATLLELMCAYELVWALAFHDAELRDHVAASLVAVLEFALAAHAVPDAYKVGAVAVQSAGSAAVNASAVLYVHDSAGGVSEDPRLLLNLLLLARLAMEYGRGEDGRKTNTSLPSALQRARQLREHLRQLLHAFAQTSRYCGAAALHLSWLRTASRVRRNPWAGTAPGAQELIPPSAWHLLRSCRGHLPSPGLWHDMFSTVLDHPPGTEGYQDNALTLVLPALCAVVVLNAVASTKGGPSGPSGRGKGVMGGRGLGKGAGLSSRRASTEMQPQKRVTLSSDHGGATSQEALEWQETLCIACLDNRLASVKKLTKRLLLHSASGHLSYRDVRSKFELGWRVKQLQAAAALQVCNEAVAQGHDPTLVTQHTMHSALMRTLTGLLDAVQGNEDAWKEMCADTPKLLPWLLTSSLSSQADWPRTARVLVMRLLTSAAATVRTSQSTPAPTSRQATTKPHKSSTAGLAVDWAWLLPLAAPLSEPDTHLPEAALRQSLLSVIITECLLDRQCAAMRTQSSKFLQELWLTAAVEATAADSAGALSAGPSGGPTAGPTLGSAARPTAAPPAPAPSTSAAAAAARAAAPSLQPSSMRHVMLSTIMFWLPKAGALGSPSGALWDLVDWMLSDAGNGSNTDAGADRGRRGDDVALQHCCSPGVLHQLCDALYHHNAVVANHPRGRMYSMLQGLIALPVEDLPLEDSPELLGLPEEHRFKPHRLNSLQEQTKYGARHFVCKLSAVLCIKTVSVKVSNMRTAKMVHTLAISYCCVPGVPLAELPQEGDPGDPWLAAGLVTLKPGQTDVTYTFPAPVMATSIKIQFDSFYTNLHKMAHEVLHCPRCSHTVTAAHGVCQYCHENAYQCGECRYINYEELDAWMCSECGHSRYGHFDVNLTCTPAAGQLPCPVSQIDYNRLVTAYGVQTRTAHSKRSELVVQLDALQQLLTVLKANWVPRGSQGTTSEEALDPQRSTDSSMPPVTPELLLVVELFHEEVLPAYKSATEAAQLLNGMRCALRAYMAGSRRSRGPTTPHAAPDQSFLFAPQPVGVQLQLPQDGYRESVFFVDRCLSLLHKLSKHRCFRTHAAAAASLGPLSASTPAPEGSNAGISHQQPTALQAQLRGQTGFEDTCAATSGSCRLQERLMDELFSSNLGSGRQEVKDLLVNLALQCGASGCRHLCRLIQARVTYCVAQHRAIDVQAAVQAELEVLATLVGSAPKLDSTSAVSAKDALLLWQLALQLLMQLLLHALGAAPDNPAVLEHVVLPCLRVLSSTAEGGLGGPQEGAVTEGHIPSQQHSLSSGGSHSWSDTGHSRSQGWWTVLEEVGPLTSMDELRGNSEAVARFAAKHEAATLRTPVQNAAARAAMHWLQQQRKAAAARQDGRSDTAPDAALGQHDASPAVLLDNSAVLRALLMGSPVKAVREETASLLRILIGPSPVLALRLLDQLHSLTPAAAAAGTASDSFLQLLLWLLENDVHAAYAAARGLVETCLVLLARLVDDLLAKEMFSVSPNCVVLRLAGRQAEAPLAAWDGSSVYRLAKVVQRFLQGKLCRKHSMPHIALIPATLAGLRMLVVACTKHTGDAGSIIERSIHQQLVANDMKTREAYATATAVVLHRLWASSPHADTLNPHDARPFACEQSHVPSNGPTVVDFSLLHIDAPVRSRMAVELLRELRWALCRDLGPTAYLVKLAKASTQEEFIRGTMGGTPYVSTEVGPLMRDVKNYICRRLDMTAFIDDDFGVELLVDGHIISLSLPVSLVYEAFWQPRMQGEPHVVPVTSGAGLDTEAMGPPMPITYRLQGLDGEASEPMVEQLQAPPPAADSSSSEMEAVITASLLQAGHVQHDPITGTQAPPPTDVMVGGRTVVPSAVSSRTVLVALCQQVALCCMPQVDGHGGATADTLVLLLQLLSVACKVSQCNRVIFQAAQLPVLVDTLLHALGSDAWAGNDEGPCTMPEDQLTQLLHIIESVAAEGLSAQTATYATAPNSQAAAACGAANAARSDHGQQLVEGGKTDLSPVVGESAGLVVRVGGLWPTQSVIERLALALSRVPAGPADALADAVARLAQGVPQAQEQLLQQLLGAVDLDALDSYKATNQAHGAERFQQQLSGVQGFLQLARGPAGGPFRRKALEHDVPGRLARYLVTKFTDPSARKLLTQDSDGWTDAQRAPGVPLALSLMQALVTDNEAAAEAIGQTPSALELLHAIEKDMSAASCGSLAEQLIERLMTLPPVSPTRQQLKQLHQRTAMQLRQKAAQQREKALAALWPSPRSPLGSGNVAEALDVEQTSGSQEERGSSVTRFASEPQGQLAQLLADMGEEEEESLACMVCKEGYKNNPGAVLGVYCYVRTLTEADSSDLAPYLPHERSPDEPQLNPTSTLPLVAPVTLATHFNAIHISCHNGARRADAALRSPKSEWEGAMLRNGNIRCNCLLPIRDPSVCPAGEDGLLQPNSSFTSAVHQFWDDVSRCTTSRRAPQALPATKQAMFAAQMSTLLLRKLVLGSSFAAETGGGSAEAHVSVLPSVVTLLRLAVQACSAADRAVLQRYTHESTAAAEGKPGTRGTAEDSRAGVAGEQLDTAGSRTVPSQPAGSVTVSAAAPIDAGSCFGMALHVLGKGDDGSPRGPSGTETGDAAEHGLIDTSESSSSRGHSPDVAGEQKYHQVVQVLHNVLRERCGAGAEEVAADVVARLCGQRTL